MRNLKCFALRRDHAPFAVIPTAAHAADYPTRPVTLVVAFTPGARADVLARIVGRQLEKVLHQPFVIENRPGGAGNIAAEAVARAKPDGYTLLMGNNSILATNGALFAEAQLRRREGLCPDQHGRHAAEHPGGPSQRAGATVAELIALAKKEPGKLNYGNSGYGAAAHLSAELFKTEAHVEIVGINYKGARPPCRT